MGLSNRRAAAAARPQHEPRASCSDARWHVEAVGDVGYAYGGGRAAGAIGAAGLVVAPTLLLIVFRQKYPLWACARVLLLQPDDGPARCS
jgi:hypothetical protein